MPNRHLPDDASGDDGYRQLQLQAQLLASVREAVIATDDDFYITYWNRGAEELFGYSAAEAEQAYLLDIMRPVLPDLALRQLQEAQNEAMWRGEGHYRRKNDDTHWLDVTICHLHGAHRERIGYVCLSRDITARKQREHELQTIASLAASLRSALRREDIYNATLAELLRLFDASAVALALPPNGSGKPFLAARGAWPAPGAAALTRRLSPHVVASGEPYFTVNLHADVATAPPSTAAAGLPLLAGNGPSLGVVWLLRDYPFVVDEHRTLRAAADIVGAAVQRAYFMDGLERQARLLRRILFTLPDGIVLLDNHRRIILCNPTAVDYLRRLDAPSQAGAVLTHLHSLSLYRLLDPKSTRTQEVTLYDPAPCVYEATAAPIDVAGRQGWIVVVRDVSAPRQANRQLSQRDRLAAIGRTVAGIAHDFSNVLAVISLYTEFLQRDPRIGADGQDVLNTIQEQTQDGATLVRQIIDFSRGKPLDRKPLALESFLRARLPLWRDMLPDTVRLTLHSAPHAPEFVPADQDALQRILANLVLNAGDAMPDGGELSLTIDRLRLEPGQVAPVVDMPPGQWLALEVADTGVGIPVELQARIFEPFFTTKGKDGTGLGLAQVYGLVRQHEGFVDVSSAPGDGATFTIYLPLPAEQLHAVE